MKTWTDSMSATRPWGRLSAQKSEHGRWIDGEVATPHGFVSVYHDAEHGGGLTNLHFLYKGRLWTRGIAGRRYTKRGLVTVAARFANQVVQTVKR